MLSIPDFISRCDAYCTAAKRPRQWLSKRLFADTYRLDVLQEGNSDVGVKRLERAINELCDLEKRLATSRAARDKRQAA